MANVTCATQNGTQQDFQIGWDNSVSFFEGKGYIPALFCEGGYAPGGYNVFVKVVAFDGTEFNTALGYYNGAVPTPILSPSPTPTDGETATTSPTPAPSESPTATAEPSPSPTASSSPSPEPSSTQTPDPTPTPESTPSSPTTPTFPENSVHATGGEWGEITLTAPEGTVFIQVYFANYGLPINYTANPECSADVTSYVALAFLGKNTATIQVTNVELNGDPCYGVGKHMSIILIYGPAPLPSTSPSPEPSPTPTPEASLEPTPSPSASPEASQPSTPTPRPEPSPTQTTQPNPSPTPLPSVVPTPSPSPTPSVPPSPEPQPSPEPSPAPSPTPSPEVTPTPSPTPSPEETPTPQPSPSPSPAPSSSASPEPTPTPTDSAFKPPIVEKKPTTDEEKTAVGLALVAALAPGEALSAAAIKEAGISYADLPPATPVEVRTDAEGNPVVITAEVADALTLVENPAELVGALFSDPAKALLALGSLGADMSPQERESAQKAVVAAVVVGQLAAQSAAGVAMSQRRGT